MISPFSITVSSSIHYAGYIYSSRGTSGSYSYTCSGSENQLLNCSTTYCGYYWWGEAAGVRCYSKQILYSCYIDHRYQDYILSLTQIVDSGCTEGDVRLAGGETTLKGRVEVCHNQTWWAVSGSYWDFRDATVVCRHLHYPANCK